MRPLALPALLMLVACGYDCGRQAPPVPPEPPATEPTPIPELPAAEATLGVRVPEPSHPAPEGAPHAMVHVPEGFVASRPWDLVVFLHGWRGCVNVLMRAGPTRCVEGTGPEHEGWDLGGAFDDAGANALFLMPQLAFRQREGSAGRFTEEGYASAFVEAVAERVEQWPTEPPRRIVVAAHSAGFETALAWIGDEGLPVSDVILFDALYAGTETFARWVAAADERRLVSIHTGRGNTAQQSRRLGRLAARSERAVGDRLSSGRAVVILETDVPHRDVPRAFLAEALQWAEARETSTTENQ